jgi:hypothetical protein
MRAQDQLVLDPAAKRTGFAANVPTNHSHLAKLFLHDLPPCHGRRNRHQWLEAVLIGAFGIFNFFGQDNWA